MFEIFSCQGNVFDIIYSSRVCALLQSALLVVTAAQEICQILPFAIFDKKVTSELLCLLTLVILYGILYRIM